MIARRRFVALALGVATMALAFPRPTRAQGDAGGKLNVEILVLYARKDPAGGHVDPQVPKIPQLSQPPFSDFNTYSFVDRQTLALDMAKASDPWKGRPTATYALVTGKSLDVVLLGDRTDKRFKMGAVLGRDAADRVRWIAPAGEPFFIGGQSYKDGILVIGITIRP
jgi:hypothetical protein